MTGDRLRAAAISLIALLVCNSAAVLAVHALHYAKANHTCQLCHGGGFTGPHPPAAAIPAIPAIAWRLGFEPDPRFYGQAPAFPRTSRAPPAA